MLCKTIFKDGLYTLELADASPATALISPSILKAKTPTPAGKRLDILTLHRRLGHLNFSDLRKLVSLGMVDGLEMGQWDESVSCEVCLRGKVLWKPFPKDRRRQASRVLELVHSDMVGPLPNSIGSNRYFITFTDDYTAHLNVDFMKHKSSMLHRFRVWKARVEKETGQKLRKICTDNAGELTSDEFEAYLESEGVIHQLTAPHTSQQNGVAERVNPTLEDSARANLIEVGLPIGFWPNAVLYGAMTQNFCPTRALLDGRIPEEAWTGQHQDVCHLRPFGCECYVQVLPEKNRVTLADKAVKCTLIGYYALPGTQSKAYKCYDKTMQKVYQSRDVAFIEHGMSSGWTEVITDLRNLPPNFPILPLLLDHPLPPRMRRNPWL
jgi:transposase InsO family protein